MKETKKLSMIEAKEEFDEFMERCKPWLQDRVDEIAQWAPAQASEVAELMGLRPPNSDGTPEGALTASVRGASQQQQQQKQKKTSIITNCEDVDRTISSSDDDDDQKDKGDLSRRTWVKTVPRSRNLSSRTGVNDGTQNDNFTD